MEVEGGVILFGREGEFLLGGYLLEFFVEGFDCLCCKFLVSVLLYVSYMKDDDLRRCISCDRAPAREEMPLGFLFAGLRFALGNALCRPFVRRLPGRGVRDRIAVGGWWCFPLGSI